MLATQCDTSGGNLRETSLQMLRPLGGSVGANYYCHDALASGIQEVQTVSVSCPLDNWIALVGQPQHVHLQFDLPRAKWECSWQQSLPSGPIRCLGHIFQKSSGINWIIVKQFRISRPPFGALTGSRRGREWISNSSPSHHFRSLGGQS
jgi:hypothetical protein